MDSIVDNLVSLINAKKARSAQGGQKDKTGAERENSGADKAYRADRREKQIIQIIEVKQTVPQ